VTCLLDDGLGVGDQVNYPLTERLYCLGAPRSQDGGGAGFVVGVLGGQAFRGPQLLQRDGAEGGDATRARGCVARRRRYTASRRGRAFGRSGEALSSASWTAGSTICFLDGALGSAGTG
jgi:hypothetical protein